MSFSDSFKLVNDFLKRHLKYDSNINLDTKIVLGEAYNIHKEWRNYIVDGEIVSSSLYRENFNLKKSGSDIPENMLNGALAKQKVFVEIVSWTDARKAPEGKVIKVLGNPGNNDVEMHAIAMEKGFDSELPKKVDDEAYTWLSTAGKRQAGESIEGWKQRIVDAGFDNRDIEILVPYSTSNTIIEEERATPDELVAMYRMCFT